MHINTLCNQNHSNAGFSLIELGLALTIIALIAGSVLMGKNLLGDARIRSLVKDLAEYSTAVDNFEQAYACLPGDCLTATKFFGTTDVNLHTVNNGNGDGIIGSNVNNNTESLGMWQHLSLGGFISGTYTGAVVAGPATGLQIWTNVPASNYSTGTIFMSWPWNPWGQYSTPNANLPNNIIASDLNVSTPTIQVFDALSIDQKLDDGLPYTGRVIGYNANDNNCVATSLASGGAHTQKYLTTTTPPTYCWVLIALQNYVYR
jgi:type II secretory pathway pseudopilin PulG